MSDPLFLLDTSVVLFLVRGSALGEYLDQTYGLRASKTRPLVSIVTHGEVRSLATRNPAVLEPGCHTSDPFCQHEKTDEREPASSNGPQPLPSHSLLADVDLCS